MMSNNTFPGSCLSPVITPLKKNQIVLVTSQENIKSIVKKLSDFPRIAIDTESNGFYAYFEKVCLIQINDGHTNYIIDTIAVKDCSSLSVLFENESIEKIMHDARNDVTGLKRDFGLSIVNLFDTSVACKVLGKKKRGLRSLLYEYFGVSISKKGQHYNWGKRPLEDSYLYYAALDVHYLIPLASMLKKELVERGLINKVIQQCQRICELEAQERSFPQNGYARLKGYNELDEKGKKIAQRLYSWRDFLARKWDIAPFRVLPNETIIRLAVCKPGSEEELQKIKGMPKRFKKGYLLKNLLEIITKNGGSSTL